jgi:hypothetical protein
MKSVRGVQIIHAVHSKKVSEVTTNRYSFIQIIFSPTGWRVPAGDGVCT